MIQRTHLLAWLSVIALAACETPTQSGGDASVQADDQRVVDPLSMPKNPTLSLDSFSGSEACGSCHPQYVTQWKTSAHAYAMHDPVFRKLTEIRQADFNGKQDQFCTQCHSAIGTRGGDCRDNFEFENLKPITLEGVNCEACHKISSLERNNNAGHRFDAEGPMQGSIEEPGASTFHQSKYAAFFEKSEFCSSCHDVIETSGLNLERPYEEWLASPAAPLEQTCQSCHMPAYQGQASVLTDERTIHDHRFVGVDVPLKEDFLSDAQRNDLRGRVEGLLRGAGKISLSVSNDQIKAGSQIDLVIEVENKISGHALPTGSTFMRQLWLEVRATDSQGKILYETGTLDENGDLKNYFSDNQAFADPDLIALNSELLDETGTPTIFSWKASEHVTRAIPAGHSRTYTLFVPTAGSASGPVTLDATLRFRALPPYLLRILNLDSLLPRLEIFSIDESSISVDVLD